MALKTPKRVYIGSVAHLTLGPRSGYTYPTLCHGGIAREWLPRGTIRSCPKCLDLLRVASGIVFFGIALQRFLRS